MKASARAAAVLVCLAAICCSPIAVVGQWVQSLAPLPGMMPMALMAPLPSVQPIPGAQTASAMAVAGGPGQSSSSMAVNNNGYTGGYAASKDGGYSSAATSGPTSGCQVLNQATSGGCEGGPCCSLTQKVEKCPGYTAAMATINGDNAQCCVVLLKAPNKTPTIFCASPYAGKNYLQMPPNAQIELKPSCRSSLTGGVGQSLACTVSFNQLPKGYTYPSGYTRSKPLSLWANKPFAGFQPCNGSKFKRFIQVVSRTRPVALTSKCE